MTVPAATTPSRVLVVDDEPMVREVVTAYLERDGFRVRCASTGPEALAMLKSTPPDLVVLDVMLPGIDGLEILRLLRASTDVPVILLTARTEETDRVIGLELGADDYVVKPFSPRELAARVRSVLRRVNREPGKPRLEYDGITIDAVTRTVSMEGKAVELTPKEFDLLAFLAASPRQVFSRGQLLEQVWGSSLEYQDPSTITVHIRRLRQKLEDRPDEPRWLRTMWGVGYKFEP